MQKLIVLLFITASTISFGQHSVSGKITDEETGEPVIGATIYSPDLEKGTISDLNGKFTLLNISGQEIELVISSLGYATKTIEVSLAADNEINIELIPSAIEMEEVIISTPFHQLQSENVMMVERVNTDDLSKSGAASLAQGISDIAGVSVISTGSGIGKPVIRGLSSNRILVYTQGVRLENQQYGGEHGLGVNSSGIESVEVIKGPATLLYGSDALGGVLYLNPEDYAPADSSTLDFKTTYYTNTLGIESNLGYKTSAQTWKFLIRGNYAVHSDYQTGNDLRVTNTRFNEFDLKTGIGFQKKSYKADLRYNYNTGKIGIPEGIGKQTLSKEIIKPYQQVDNHILSLDNTYFLQNSSLNLKIGYLYNNRKEFEEHHHELHEEELPEPHQEGPSLEMHLETISYDLKYNLPELGDFETIIGIQGMFQSNQNYGEEILIPNAQVRDFGILSTTHYHTGKIDIQGGLRFDLRSIESDVYGSQNAEKFIPAINRNFNSLNGAIGVKFLLGENLNSRINFATGFRAPNLAELTSNGVHHGSNRYEVGNPLLGNEQNFQIDLALEYSNEHFELFANPFYNRISGYIYLSPTGAVIEENPVFAYVQNDAVLYGGEAGLHLHPHPVDWLHFESGYEMVIGKRDNGEYLPLIPAHTITNTLRLEFENVNWVEQSYSFISLENVFEQNRPGNFELPTNGYSLLSAGFGGTLEKAGKQLQIRLSGRNLLDKTYYSHLSRLKSEGIYNMGRNITISLKLIL